MLHAKSLLFHVHAVASRNNGSIAVGRVGNVFVNTPRVRNKSKFIASKFLEIIYNLFIFLLAGYPCFATVSLTN